jgi:predicted ArsR family transcriptional regulator
MPTSRQKILNYVIEQQSTSVEELSKAFHVTPANIRHHLSILTEQGSISIIGQKATTKKGRPAQLYCSKQFSDQNNFDRLSRILLQTLLSMTRSEEKYSLIETIASYLAAEFKTSNINPTRRLYATIYALNKLNYQAHWEAHSMNPRVMLGHCPYQAIIGEHPELCLLDASLIEQLSGAPARQIEKQTINVKGLAQCIFLLNTPA